MYNIQIYDVVVVIACISLSFLITWSVWCLHKKREKEKTRLKNKEIRIKIRKEKERERMEREKNLPAKIIITSANKPTNQNPPPDPSSRQSSILLVEDSPTSMLAIKKVLIKHGYKVFVAEDGLKAWTKIQKIKPDLMISDIDMPNMNGLELLNLIRSDLKLMDLPVILITGSVSFHLKATQQAGVDGLLSKPFKDKSLIQQIRYILQE